MISRVPVIGNASAKVSATGVPFNSIKASGAAFKSVASVKVFYLRKRSTIIPRLATKETGERGSSVAVEQTKETSLTAGNDL